MTEVKTNLFKRCNVCTGCGRCPWDKPDFTIVSAPSGHLPVYDKIDTDPGEAIVAVDIGTTTIVMQLRRVTDGEIIDTYRAVNPQRKYGADVLSRIQAADIPEQKQEMKDLVYQVLEEGLEQFKKVLEDAPEEASQGADTVRQPGHLTRMFIAANTTMIHLFMGYEVSGLGKAPFLAEHLEEIRTRICGVPTVILPGISTFVGADITAGLYGKNFDLAEDICLFVDLGTNGEMAVGNRSRILTTATAAGPAFEGRAGVGIWGADMVAMTSALLQQGLLDETGLLEEPYFKTGVRIGDTLLRKEDIRSLQMAKAAICAGIRILCKKYGIRQMNRIGKVYLAGGFGYFLNPQAAVRIGLLPKELEGRIEAVGNTSLEGAFLYGREWKESGDNKAGRRMRDIIRRSSGFNLATQEEFSDIYIESMNLKEA